MTLHVPFTPTEGSTAGREWWRHAVIYQIYPRSFASSSGPIGDLPGITSRLPHLAELGVDAIWLSPFYKSPQNDAGYDVEDYRDVDPRMGTLADADAMIARAHELGLKVIVDLVPNHTSDRHEWFRAALAAPNGSPERNRYWFREGELPNNWRSIFGGSAWTRVCDRPDAPGSPWENDQTWYLNLFDSSQPDLNWDNPEVHAEFRSVLRFWLDRGVDGFRVDVAHGLVKDPSLPDWSGEVHMAGDADLEEDRDDAGRRAPMFDQDGVHEIYREWHEVLAEYEGDRCLVAEAWVDPPERLARYVRPDEMHQAFNFDFLASEWKPALIREVIQTSYEANDAVGAPTTWVMSNHDVIRHASRLGLAFTGKKVNGIGAEDPQPDAELGLARATAATLLMLGLAGSAYLYQGEELGLPEHTTLPDRLREDPAFFRTKGEEKGRDGCRVPIPWEADATGFGFSPTGETWLPQPAEWAAFARDAQAGVPGSTLELYRSALALRRSLGLGLGEISELADGEDHLAYVSRDPLGERADVLILTTFDAPAKLPVGWEAILSSAEIADHTIPANCTVWASRQ